MAKHKKAAKSAANASGEQSNANADEQLKTCAREVKQVFQTFETAQHQQAQRQTIRELGTKLTTQVALEEEVLFPELRKHGVDEDLLDRKQVELDGVKVLLNDLMTQAPDEPYFRAKVSVLSDLVKHHLGADGDCDGLLAKGREKGVDVAELGKSLQELKQQSADEAAGGLKPLQVRSLATSIHEQETQGMSTRGYGQEGRGGRGRYEDDDDGYSQGYGSGQRGGMYGQQNGGRDRQRGSEPLWPAERLPTGRLRRARRIRARRVRSARTVRARPAELWPRRLLRPRR
jgi:hypothetical protein